MVPVHQPFTASVSASHDTAPRHPARPPLRPGAPPIFDKIGIVGLGLIGGSIALAARQLWPTSLVIGVDNKDVLETAMRLHAIDVAADDLIVLAEADLVILAAPVRQNMALLGGARRERPQPAVITDTGSTKREIVEAAARCRRASRSSAGIRSAARRRAGSSTRGRICSSGRPWLSDADGRATRSGRRLDKLLGVRAGARRGAPRDGASRRTIACSRSSATCRS